MCFFSIEPGITLNYYAMYLSKLSTWPNISLLIWLLSLTNLNLVYISGILDLLWIHERPACWSFGVLCFFFLNIHVSDLLSYITAENCIFLKCIFFLWLSASVLWVFWDRISLCNSPGHRAICTIDEASLNCIVICLPLSPQYWA